MIAFHGFQKSFKNFRKFFENFKNQNSFAVILLGAGELEVLDEAEEGVVELHLDVGAQ